MGAPIQLRPPLRRRDPALNKFSTLHPHTSMASITRYSTRLMGFHLREYRKAEGDETEMFSARIYLGESEIGIARNEGTGGPDRIDIWSPHREVWERLTRYMGDHPIAVAADGTPDEYMSGEEAALMILRDLHDAELKLFRARKYRSGLVGYVWDRSLEDSSWWATAHVLLTAAASVGPADAERALFRILVLGTDNERFARADAPLPGRRA